MYFYILIILVHLQNIQARCPNGCSGHGYCGISNICNCYTGWNGGAADCSFRECPYGVAWADTPTYTDTAHESAECSNYGICDRNTGECQCFEKFTGPACERARCPSDCSGHGICTTISEATLFMGLDYDSTILYGGDGYGSSYSNWDSQSITICECEDGFFGPDCSLVMCPKGDDPVTINQDYRTISLYVTTQTPAYTYPSGKLGLELYGKVAFIDLALPEKCSQDLSFSGPFGEVACSYVRTGDHGSYLTFELTFLSWPSTSMDTNMYYNVGNPSLYDFHCDISRVAFIRITECKFTDIYATNVMEYAPCSNRGECDYDTGMCTCFDNFFGSACGHYIDTSGDEDGANALPALIVNVNGGNYKSSALLLESAKAKAPDFNHIECIADSEVKFTVRGDGTMEASSLNILSLGGSIYGGGLFISMGGLSTQENGITVYSKSDTFSVGSIYQQYKSDLASSYVAMALSTLSPSSAHYILKAGNLATTKFSIGGNGQVNVFASGASITGGVTINSGGLAVSGGMTVLTNGIQIFAGGIRLTRGLTIHTNGLKVLQSGCKVYTGGMTISSAGMMLHAGGLTVTSGGLYLSAVGGLSLNTNGLKVTDGLTVFSSGMVVKGGVTIADSGLIVNTAGLSILNNGVTVSGGITVQMDGFFVTGGLTIANDGLRVPLAALSVNAGGINLIGGVSIRSASAMVSGGLTVSDVGATVIGGATVQNAGVRVVSSGLVVSGPGVVQDDDTVVSGGATVSSGGVRVGSGGVVVTGGLTVYQQTYLQTSYTTFGTSDRRLKTAVEPITGALQKVSRLQGVYFNWIQNEESGLQLDGKRHVGLMAQEVQVVLPEAVGESPLDAKYLGVDYAALTPLLIEAIHDVRDNILNFLSRRGRSSKVDDIHASSSCNMSKENSSLLRDEIAEVSEEIRQAQETHRQLVIEKDRAQNKLKLLRLLTRSIM